MNDTTNSSAKKVDRWSGRVTRESDALDLESDVFKKRSASAIALSLKRSAEQSERKKSSPFRSAMSMLTFYINRAGENLPSSRLKVLQRAKDELRKLYDRPAGNEPAPKTAPPGTAKKRAQKRGPK